METVYVTKVIPSVNVSPKSQFSKIIYNSPIGSLSQ